MLESKVQKTILDYLNTLDDSWAVKTVVTNRNGTPDILLCLRGKFYAIEVKRPGHQHRVSKIQQYQLNQITAAGGVAFVADSLATVKKLINN